MAHVIKITGSNTSTGLLELSDHGRTRAYRRTKVIWQIHDSDVSSIEIVAKPSTPDIWSSIPHRQGNHWEGTTRQNVADNTEYVYSINWTSADGSSHTHDPIISIRPSGFDSRIAFVLLATAAAVAAICALKLLDRKKHR